MKKFIFIAGPVAAGKTTLMEKKLYNSDENLCNFFDHDQKKLMIQLYGKGKSKVNDLALSSALENAITDCLENNKDFMMQIHFTNEQLSQINTYLHKYKNKFEFHAHFIGVSDFSILKERANKREQLGGHSSEGKSIEKSFKQSFKNFITYLPKMKEVTIWDNSKEFGFNSMEEQLVFKQGNLFFKNSNLTSYSNAMLNTIIEHLNISKFQKEINIEDKLEDSKGRIFEIYSIKKDQKVYFKDVKTSEKYSSTIPQLENYINKGEFKHLKSQQEINKRGVKL